MAWPHRGTPAQVPRLLGTGPAPPPRPRADSVGSAERPRTGPVVVLTYAHAGGAKLQDLLSEHPEVACTSGTGLLPLCEHALGAWRRIEEWPSAATASSLAVTSIRSLVATMMTVLAARTGRSRWCETATVSQEAAQSFLAVFPQARFVCLHRPCDAFIRAALAARPWGLSGPAFAPYTSAHPTSTVAALAAYWVAHTRPSLDFEAAHPQQCVRVHFDDLDADPRAVMRALARFLELGAAGPALRPPETPDTAEIGSADATGASGGDHRPLPLGQLPPSLLAQVDDLHDRLGYPPLRSE